MAEQRSTDVLLQESKDQSKKVEQARKVAELAAEEEGKAAQRKAEVMASFQQSVEQLHEDAKALQQRPPIAEHHKDVAQTAVQIAEAAEIFEEPTPEQVTPAS